jgi:hypothetical protein
MKPSIKAIAVSVALLWGGCMLLIGLINLADPSYGGAFLRMISSVYPGADTQRTLGSVLLGTIYGLVDGAIAGCLFGLLYSAFGRQHSPMH